MPVKRMTLLSEAVAARQPTEVLRLVEQLQNALAEFENRMAQVRADGTLSAQQMAAFREKYHKTAHLQAQWFVQRLLGEWQSPSEPLLPGAIVKALDAAARRIRQARGAADSRRDVAYWAQLEHEKSQVPVVLASMRNVGELREYIETCSDIQRRALCDCSAAIAGKFGGEPIGSLLAGLKRDVESQSSPELAAAIESELAVKADCAQALAVCKRAKLALEDNQPFVGVGLLSKVTGRWTASYHFEDVTAENSPVIWELSQRAPSVRGGDIEHPDIGL